MKKVSRDEKLRSLYYDLRNPTAYTGSTAIARKAKIKKSIVDDFLDYELPHALHKVVPRKFPRRKTIGIAPGETWQADLADLSKLAKYNDGYRFLLVCVDCYSRMVYIAPLRRKTGAETAEALGKLFEQAKVAPSRFITDQGKEFYSSENAKLFKAFNVTHYSPKSEMKAALCERYIRMLKTRLFRYFTHRNTYTWIDVIDKFVSNYNKTTHTVTRIAPNKVKAGDVDEGIPALFGTEEQKKNPNTKRSDFELGQCVRLSKHRAIFDKKFPEGWNRELFVVSAVFNRESPTMYELKTLDGEEKIEGRVYGKELQRAKDTGVYRIDKILKRKKIRGKEHVLVTFLDYPNSPPSWIPAVDFVNTSQ